MSRSFKHEASQFQSAAGESDSGQPEEHRLVLPKHTTNQNLSKSTVILESLCVTNTTCYDASIPSPMVSFEYFQMIQDIECKR